MESHQTHTIHLHAPRADGAYSVPALKALSEITAELTGESDVETLLERFLGTMMRLAGASAGAVWLLSADDSHLRLVSSHGLPPDLLAHERVVKFPCGICGAAILKEEVSEEPDMHACGGRTESTFFGGVCHKIVAVPLRHRNRMLGVFSLFLPEGRAVPDHIAVLFSSISEHLGLALENARLTRENLRMTLMAERQMLASEIHDSLAQTLAYMKMRLTVMREAMERGDVKAMHRYTGDFEEAIGEAYGTIRELIANFRNRMDPRGLLPALTELAGSFRLKTGIELSFRNLAPGMHLTVDEEVQVFHIVQEALNNVAKHSGATRAELVLCQQDTHYVVTVEDDGRGIVPHAIRDGDSARVASFGMNIMRERAARLGGDVSISPTHPGGTRVTLRFPIWGGGGA